MSNKRARGFAFTVNNWTEEDWSALQRAPSVRYLVMGKEVAPTTGTPHIQGYVFFELQKTFSAARTWFESVLGHARAHVEMAYANALANCKYCMKDADPSNQGYERGERPKSDREKGEDEKVRAKRNLEALIDNRIEDVDLDVVAHQLRNYEYGAAALKRARRSAPKALDGVLDNVWVYGPRGSGKDTYVRGQLAERPHYLKSLEPYWDKYDDEEDVYIEDIDREALKVTRLLKIWADRYPFDGRRMYGLGQCIIRPKRIWVTSQYHPKDLFNKEDAEAIIRRFRIVHMVDGVGRPERRQWTARPTPIILEEEAPAAPHPTPDPPSPDRFGLYLLD